jgi:hypothetical protein
MNSCWNCRRTILGDFALWQARRITETKWYTLKICPMCQAWLQNGSLSDGKFSTGWPDAGVSEKRDILQSILVASPSVSGTDTENPDTVPDASQLYGEPTTQLNMPGGA